METFKAAALLNDNLTFESARLSPDTHCSVRPSRITTERLFSVFKLTKYSPNDCIFYPECLDLDRQASQKAFHGHHQLPWHSSYRMTVLLPPILPSSGVLIFSSLSFAYMVLRNAQCLICPFWAAVVTWQALWRGSRFLCRCQGSIQSELRSFLLKVPLKFYTF